MAGGVTIDGEKALYKFLKEFSQEITQKVMNKAVRAGATVVLKEMKRRVPVRTGNLKESIKVVKRKKVDGRRLGKDELVYSVLPKRNTKRKTIKLKDGTKWKIKGVMSDGWYAHMVEYGTVKQSAQPFMRPAIEATRVASFDKFKSVAKKETAKYLAAKGRSL